MSHADPLAQSIQSAARSVLSIAPAIIDASNVEPCLAEAAKAVERGYFTPQEDECLRITFAKYLLTRAALHEAVAELKPIAFQDSVPSPFREQAFLVGYAAASVLVNAATFIVQRVHKSPLLRQKLDESEPRYGIPRKQFAHIYRSLTSPKNLVALHQAERFARQHARELEAYATDSTLKEIQSLLEKRPLPDPGLRRSVVSRLQYRLFALKRRNLSGYQQALFAVFEGSGRVIAELRNPLREKSVTPSVREEVHRCLRPGDVLVTRHRQAMSNLFLPGFWPHAAFFIGSSEMRRALGISGDEPSGHRTGHPIEILEAKKDGVLLRPLAETLDVDFVSIIRPLLPREHLRTGIERGLTHAGKLYDFTFDFTRADRLVCTEVIYRSLDGIGGIRLPLTERAGRLTLSAEDLLQKAVQRDGFEVVGVFGVGDAATRPIFGERARTIIQESMNDSS